MTLQEIEDRLNKSLESMDCVDIRSDGHIGIDGIFNASDIKKIAAVMEQLPELLKL